MSYNERGQSTGMANVTFRNGELAKKAVAQFSGAPIDGGKSRLRLNIVVDPTVQPARPLTERIRAISRERVVAQKAKPVKGPSKKATAVKARKQKPKAKKEKQPKKNLEDLDKEMADYFGEGKN